MLSRTCAVLLLATGVLVLEPAASSDAQTACPVGTTPGSATCGPSPGSQIPAPPPRPSGEWIKTWGAIATSTSGGGGASSQRLSKDDAEQLALRNCVDSGAANCRIDFSYYNQCVALAYPVGKNGGKVNTASTVERAKSRVLAACEKELGGECKVALAECSEPVFRKF